MLDPVYEECGIAAAADLGVDPDTGEACSEPADVAALIPRMLMDIQNRGQLAAGFTVYNGDQRLLLKTHKQIGSVRDVFALGDKQAHLGLMRNRTGSMAIGHTRYATSGTDDPEYAQPYERRHGRPYKWFSFCFNGNVANHSQLFTHLRDDLGYHLLHPDCDTELFQHYIAFQQRGQRPRDWATVFRRLCTIVDGAWNIALVSARGDLCIARDPTGLKPLCWGRLGRFVVFASESIALQNLGVPEIEDVPPGTLIHVRGSRIRQVSLRKTPKVSHCFFEWVYFSHVASRLDGRSVYQSRNNMGRALARIETQPITDDHIVVPVPDTAKAAGDGFAYTLGIPAIEGLVRNRYSGDRTFIESSDRRNKVARKFVALRGILEGKKVFLVDDSLVRSTTIKYLVDFVRREGRAKEIHVRIACPPIMGPCFYGIDMSTIGELFAPRHLEAPVKRGALPPEVLERMAASFGADSLQYLPVHEVPRCIGLPRKELCMACVDRSYPTPVGRELFKEAQAAVREGRNERLTTSGTCC
ncbi:MAG: amidophosphoribosyltransferase [Planctomycetota bacterium]